METALGLIGGGVLATLITLAGTYYFWVLQRSRKELGYEILSGNVIIPRLQKPTPGIRVMVKASLLKGEPLATYMPVDGVFGFRVRVRNSGNQVLEKQRVTFTMDEKARIISIEPEEAPDLGGLSITCTPQHQTSNVALAEIPFLNPGQQVIFSLQSVDNAGTTCSVSAGAPGLRYFDMERRRDLVKLRWLLAGGLLLVVSTGVLLLLDELDIVSPNKAMIAYVDLSVLVVSGLLLGIALAIGRYLVTPKRRGARVRDTEEVEALEHGR